MQPRFRFLLIIIVLFTLSACDNPEEKFQKHINNGHVYYKEHEYKKALLEYKNAAKIKPSDYTVIYYMGLVEEADGKLQKALSAYLTAEQQNPNYIPVKTKLAEFYLTAGMHDEAYKRVGEILELDSKNASAHAVLASLHLANNNMQDAQKEINLALQYDPKNMIAYSVQVGLYTLTENRDKALETLGTAIKIYPEELSFHLLKAAIYNQIGDINSVVDTYNDIFSLYPNAINFRFDLAKILLQHEQYELAEKQYNETIASFPENLDAKKILLTFLENNKDFHAAVNKIQDFISKDTSQGLYYIWLADLYVRNNQDDQAMITLQNIIESTPNNSIGLNASTRLARIKLEKGDIPLAEDLVNTVLAKDAGNTVALLLQANLDFYRGDYQTAISSLNVIMQGGSNTLEASRILAEAFLVQSRLDLAIDTLIQATKKYPEDKSTLVRLSQLYALRGNQEKAEQILLLLANNNPDNPLILETTARLAIEDNKLERAALAVEKLSKIKGQDLTAKYLEGRILQKSDQISAAQHIYENIIVSDPLSPLAAYAMSSILETMNTKQELQDFVVFLGLLPQTNAAINTVIGDIQQSLGHTESAKAAYRKAFNQNTETQASFLALAKILMEEKNYSQALEILEHAESAVPSEINASILKAQILLNTGEIERALAIYEKLLTTNNQSDVVANNFAQTVADYKYTDVKLLEKARLQAERFINSNNPYYLDTLGWIYYRKNLLPQAKLFLERAFDNLEQSNPQIDYHYGAILYEIGNIENAKLHLKRASLGADYPGKNDAKTLLDEID